MPRIEPQSLADEIRVQLGAIGLDVVDKLRADWGRADNPIAVATVAIHRMADALLAARWRPPRVITTAEELAAVERGVVVRARDGSIACRFDEQCGVVFGDDRPFPWSALHAPATVLYEPEETKTDD